LPAHLFERAHLPGGVSGRPPTFDFDRALSIVGETNQQIDIAKLRENRIGLDQPIGRCGGAKSFDRTLLYEASVSAPAGALVIQQSEEEGKDRAFGNSFGFKAWRANAPHDSRAEPNRAHNPVEDHEAKFRPPRGEFFLMLRLVHLVL
jgi:hypothetical protein